MVVAIIAVNSILLMGEFRVEKGLGAPSLCFVSSYSVNARECE